MNPHAYTHPSEPDYIGARHHGWLSWTRCYCNFGPKQDTTSTTSPTTTTATDEAVLTQGGGDVTKAGDFSDVTSTSLNIGAGAKLGGVDVSGANLSGGLTVTTADPQVVRDALAAVAASTQSFTGTVESVVNAANVAAAQNSKLLSELSLSRQTDGASVAGKNIVWIMLGLLAAVVLGIWAWRAS